MSTENKQFVGLTARFPQLPRRGLLLGLSPLQVTFAGIAVAALVMGLFTGGMAGLMMVSPFVLVAAAIAFVRIKGRPITEWLPIVGSREVAVATDQHMYRARPARFDKPVSVGSLGLPGSAARLKVLESSDGTALVFDGAIRTVSAVVRVTAPAFVLLDSDEQRRNVAGWGRALAAACHGGKVARIQVLERTIPDSGDALEAWWREHGHSDDSWPAAVYEDLIRSAGPASERHETYLALSVDLKKCSRQIRQQGGGTAGASAVMEMEKAALVRSLLAAGVSVQGWLGARELAGIVRSAYDPASTVPLDRRTHIDASAAGVKPGAAGPVAVDEEWSYLRSDSGYHAVYWIAEWPRIEAHASFLHPLMYVPGVRRSLSIVFEPVSIDVALRQIRAEKVHHAVDAQQRERLGQLTTEQQRQEAADVHRRERELVAGHGDVRFAGLLAVTAPDKDALEQACGVIETSATQALVDVRRLVGQQAEAFIAAALPLGRGLR